jgi:hypothetical protein
MSKRAVTTHVDGYRFPTRCVDFDSVYSEVVNQLKYEGKEGFRGIVAYWLKLARR